MQKFWGWIPTLTGKIFLSPINAILVEKGFCCSSEGKYNKKVALSDISGDEPVDIEVEIPKDYDSEKEENHIFVRISECELEIKCYLHQTGLVQFEPTKISDQCKALLPQIISEVYYLVKDIYHCHTHHKVDEDRLLKIVDASTEDEAVKKIFLQYEEKIITYHRFLKGDITSSSPIEHIRQSFKKIWDLIRYFVTGCKYTLPSYPIAIPLFKKALGEMVYGSKFLSLYKKKFQEYEELEKSIRASMEAISILQKEFDQILSDTANKSIFFLTLVLVWIAFVQTFPKILLWSIGLMVFLSLIAWVLSRFERS